MLQFDTVITNNDNFFQRTLKHDPQCLVFKMFILQEFRSAGAEPGVRRISGECLFTEQKQTSAREEKDWFWPELTPILLCEFIFESFQNRWRREEEISGSNLCRK